MELQRLKSILNSFSKLRVGVIGDYYLDRYGEGVYNGISRETGDKVVKIGSQDFSPGGCANIAWNVSDLGTKTYALSVVGDDYYGSILLSELKKRDINSEFLIIDKDWKTSSFEKIKVWPERNKKPGEVRLDVENTGRISKITEKKIIRNIERLLPRVDALIIADYNEIGKGILTDRVVNKINKLASNTKVIITGTSRLRINRFKGEILVINVFELMNTMRRYSFSLSLDFRKDDLVRAGKNFAKKIGNSIFTTWGKRGVLVFPKEGENIEVKTVRAGSKIDITGAGDTAISAVTLALASGSTTREAAEIANMASYITIHKFNTTGTANRFEIIDIYNRKFKNLNGGF